MSRERIHRFALHLEHELVVDLHDQPRVDSRVDQPAIHRRSSLA